MSSLSGAPAPAFSYAQAAKGLASAASTQSASRNESPAASDKSIKDRTSAESANTYAALKSPRSRPEAAEKMTGESTTPKLSAQAEGVASKPSTPNSADKEGVVPTQYIASNSNDSPESSTASHVDPVDLVPNQHSQQDEATQQLPNGRRPVSDEFAAQVPQDQNNLNVSEKKAKEGEDDWEKVSVPSMAAEAQYKAAPIPSVNVWQVRAAKLKEQTKTSAPSPPTQNQPKKSRSASEDFKRKPPGKEVSSIEKEPKNTESASAPSKKDILSSRTSRPISQQGEKADGEAPPPVIDTQSWPTPENSTVDERRKSASYDRLDRSDSKAGPQRSHGNKWVTVPFVPTARFETQLPPSAARRGGRGGGRGREIGGRGGAPTEKQDGPSSMGPPPLPRTSGEQDRGRRSEDQDGIRGLSAPSSTRPVAGEDSTSAFRKSNTAYNKDQSPPEFAGNTMGAAQQTGEDQAAKTDHSSRSSSRHTGNAANRRVNGERSNPTEQGAGGFVQASDARQSFPYDRNKATATGTSRGNGEFGRERGPGKTRDWARDKPESAREKVESWRDRESAGDQGSRRGGRSERGRGAFRGRDHAYNPSFTPSHAYTSPLPQNGFEPPSRSTSHTETRSRQASQPFVSSQAANTQRNNPRSQSIPVGMLFPGTYYTGMPAMSQQGIPPLQTEMSMYSYPSQMQMPPSIMGTMPYNDPLNSYALLSMVMTQIEYYFSIDNLCKDLFLRKHMDGQGYVPLNVIANFKRIKTLTEDNMTMDNLRYVCQQVKSVEYLPGMDGEDRLRRREGWRDFVLPVEERFESARNDGPLHTPESYNRPMQQDQTTTLDPSFGYNQLRSPPLAMATNNGAIHASSPMSYLPVAVEENQLAGGQSIRPFEDPSNEFAARPAMGVYSRTSSTAVRSPPASAAPQLHNVINGHHRQNSRPDIEENVFPDEQIPNVNIRMQPQTVNGESPSFSGIARVASGGSSTGRNEVGNVPIESSQAHVPGLRGGAASPQQLEQFSKLSFGNANTISMRDENIIYFTKDGQETQLPPPQPGQYDQTYLSLHDVALQQRQMGVKEALEPLYNFWTDFLVDKFNLGMYQEFKTFAIGDLQEGHDSGMSHLVRYFAKVLSGPVPISERLASDMVNLSREETPDKRPILQTMRAAWRNGATHLKSIKRLGDVLTPEEKAELDKSG